MPAPRVRLRPAAMDTPAQEVLAVAAVLTGLIQAAFAAQGQPGAWQMTVLLLGAGGAFAIAALIRRRGHDRAAAMVTALVLLAVSVATGLLFRVGRPLALLAPAAFLLVVPYLRGWRLAAFGVATVAAAVYAMDRIGNDPLVGTMAIPARITGGLGTAVATTVLLLLAWRTVRVAEQAQADRGRLVADVPVGIVLIDRDRGLAEVNRAFAAMVGETDPDALIGVRLASLQVDPSVNPLIGPTADPSGLRIAVVAVRRRDGSEAWLRFRTRVILDEAGAPAGYEGAVEDVTAERSEREAQVRLRDVLESLPDAVFSLAFDGTFLSWNRGAERVYGYTADELLGHNMLEIVRPSHGTRFRGVLDVVAAGRVVPPFEMDQRRKDGGGVVVSLSAAPIRDADGKVVAASIVGRDVTEQHRLVAQQADLEGQLLQAQKMEAVGRLAGGVAHDFNNLLTAITGFGGLVASELSGRTLDDQLQVLRAAERAGDLTRQLLAFSRRSAADPRPVDIDAILADAFRMVRRLVPERIEVELDAASHAWVVADPVELEQVLLNLVVNAVDATPDAGYIRVSTSAVELDEAFTEQHLGAVEGPHVLLQIADTGVGMDETVVARIFEPFFTTKERGEGTGLGLATVYAIVRRSAGTVWVDSAPGVGTTFSVYLPVTSAVGATATGEAPEIPTGSETILLLEDEEAVRLLTQRILERAGYRVHAAASPAEASTRLAAIAFDALISDVIMPGQSGPDFVARLPETLPVVFVSGYTGAGTTRMRLDLPTRSLVAKPFDPAGLAIALRRVLDAADGEREAVTLAALDHPA